MTRDELIERAAKALHRFDIEDAERELRIMKQPIPEKWADPWHECSIRQLTELRRRAAALVDAIEPLIRADENEACAKIVEARKPLYTHLSGINACSECASSIRARRKV